MISDDDAFSTPAVELGTDIGAEKQTVQQSQMNWKTKEEEGLDNTV